MNSDEPINVLAVDDDRDIRGLLTRTLELEGFSARVAASGEEALELAGTTQFEVCILDLVMEGLSGTETLEKLRALELPPEVIILTGEPSVETAVAAMKGGAGDYLQKPFHGPELALRVRTAAARHRVLRENEMLRRLVDHHQYSGRVVSKSPKMQAVLRTTEKIAASDAPVLVLGETGSGKGLIAKTIHERSRRSRKPFIHVNCGGLQEQLVESEFFGHEKGAFTGATSHRPGLFEVADKGTLFLDEVTELSLGMQAELLQVLDTGELRRVGSNRLRSVDARVVAATNKDIAEEVRKGNFRQDLFFRMNVITLRMPPLRERGEDLDDLIDLYLDRFGGKGSRPKAISEAAREKLRRHPWPGNVRELANTMQRALLLSTHPVLQPEEILIETDSEPIPEPERDGHRPRPLREMERLQVIRALEFSEQNRARAARILGIDVKTLRNKIKSYGLES